MHIGVACLALLGKEIEVQIAISQMTKAIDPQRRKSSNFGSGLFDEFGLVGQWQRNIITCDRANQSIRFRKMLSCVSEFSALALRLGDQTVLNQNLFQPMLEQRHQHFFAVLPVLLFPPVARSSPCRILWMQPRLRWASCVGPTQAKAARITSLVKPS